MMSATVSTESVSMTTSTGPVCAVSSTLSTPSNPVPTSMLSFRFATPNNTKTPYYISSDIVLSGGIAQQNRRRIVHNEVEKRRKDKITNWIKRLGDLLPRHRVLKQSKNNVLESACDYITELREMSSQFGPMKSSKKKLEQEIAELKNKINKLEDENKRLSELIHQNNITIPTTWSDSSAITTTMRATSLPRNSCLEQTISANENNQATCVTWTSLPSLPRSQNSTTAMVDSVTAPNVIATAANRLSVASILSTSGDHSTSAGSGMRPIVVSAVAPTATSRPVATDTNTRNALPATVLAVTWPATPTNTTPTSLSINNGPPADLSAGNLQPLVVAPLQPSTYNMVVSSISNPGSVSQFQQQTVTTPSGFERGLPSATMRSNKMQENISQLPYSVETLTGNQTSLNRPQVTTSGHISSFSAESLINRHDTTNNQMVMINNPSNQPVIQNTFTLTHPTTLTNTTPQSSAPPQTFSNFSALSLVGSSTPFTVSVSSATPASTRTGNTEQDSTPISHSSNQIFTDFSTESLIGSSEFSSDFAIDNLISRSDSNVHMAAVNPNLIQSFGKGNDPMISSVCGDHCPQSSSLHDPHGLGPSTSHLPFGSSLGSIGPSKHLSDQTNVPLYPPFSTILSPPLFTRSLETGTNQPHITVNSTTFFPGSFLTPFQVS